MDHSSVAEQEGALEFLGLRTPDKTFWLMGLVLVLAFLRLIEDPDIWFHLTFGREITAHGVPDQEFYVFTRFGESVDYNEWGFGVFYFWVYSLFGFSGMALANAAMGAATVLLVTLAARKNREQPATVPLLVVATATYLWLEFRFVNRPETFLYLGIAAEIFCLETYLANCRKRWLVPIPVISTLVGLFHPSALIVIGIAGLYAVQSLWSGRRDSVGIRSRLGPLAIMLASAFILSGLNPAGYEQLILPIRFILYNPAVSTLTEFLPALDTAYRYHFLSLALLGVCALLYYRPFRILDLLLYVTFAYLAFRYVRNIPLLALVVHVPLVRASQHAWDRIEPWIPGKATFLRVGIALACATVAVAIPLKDKLWGVGLKAGCCPQTSVALLREHRPAGNILNFYHLGNYLGWALDGLYPVFIDGRNNVGSIGLKSHNFMFRADRGWQMLAARHDIGIVVTRATLLYSGTLIPLVEVLSKDPDWILVAAEPAALTFFRRTEVRELKTLHPVNPNEIWNQVLYETDFTINANPRAPGIYRSRAIAYLNLGQMESARDSFRTFRSLGGNDSRLENAMR